jgi:putative ABC transport system permease protein
MQDIRLALRNLRMRPAFSAVVILTLTLGIGANTAVFTVMNAVVLAPLPYANPGDVVVLNEQTPEIPLLSATRQNYEAWRDRAQSFSAMGAVRATNMTLTGGVEPERVPIKMMSASVLPLLGVSITNGRGFTQADDRPGAQGVAVLAAGFATRRFAGTQPLGRSIELDNHSYTVVGVLPDTFELFQAADVYVPYGPWAATLPDDRGWHPGILPIARLKPGVSIDQARVEMDAIARQLEAEFRDSNTSVRVLVSGVQEQMVQNVRPALLILSAAVLLVLLIACANVANLLLARAVGRQKEIAVRIALGASRGRIVRQLIVESIVLSSVGGAAGLALAWWGVSLLTLTGATAATLPRAYRIGVAWPVAFFALALSVVTGLIFGLLPALQGTRFDIRESLHEEGRGASASRRHRSIRAVLVVGEVALALVLLVGAGLLLRSFSALTHVSPGFDESNLLVVNLPLAPLTYTDNVARTSAVERIVARVAALPGVGSAAMTTMVPMAGAGTTIHFNRAARPPKGPEDYVMAGFRAVTPEYLSVLRVPLERGRMLAVTDDDRAPRVVVVNESMARQFFPGINPIGQRIQLGTEPSADFPVMEIVGIVGDMKQSFETGSKAEMFVPYAQYPDPILAQLYLNTALVVRTSADPMTLAASVRSAVQEIDPNQPLVNLRTMETAVAGSVAQPRLQMILLAIFAVVAVALAVVGVYGMMAYNVSQRIPEIGVRMAIGASPGQVVGMVVWQGARLTLIGIGMGLVAAAFAAAGVQHLLFQVRGIDPVTFVVAPAILAAAALLASYIPALRAARVSPSRALNR